MQVHFPCWCTGVYKSCLVRKTDASVFVGSWGVWAGAADVIDALVVVVPILPL